jgi:hypothetical protein
MTSDLSRIETCLVRDVSRYLQAPDSDGERALSSDLEFLLEALWPFTRLAQDRWFDGLTVGTYRVRKGRRIDVRGLMVWGTLGSDKRQWVDVFASDLCAVDGRVSYTLRFGRKGVEDRRVPYGEHRDLLRELEQPRDWEWAFVFKSPDPLFGETPGSSAGSQPSL